MHSDTPIGPAKPLEWAWIAVNRFGQSGKVLAPAERIKVTAALRMITIDAAYTLVVDELIGSIEPGKFADFTVLEQDSCEVAPDKLNDVPIWGTIVGGRLTLSVLLNCDKLVTCNAKNVTRLSKIIMR